MGLGIGTCCCGGTPPECDTPDCVASALGWWWTWFGEFTSSCALSCDDCPDGTPFQVLISSRAEFDADYITDTIRPSCISGDTCDIDWLLGYECIHAYYEAAFDSGCRVCENAYSSPECYLISAYVATKVEYVFLATLVQDGGGWVYRIGIYRKIYIGYGASGAAACAAMELCEVSFSVTSIGYDVPVVCCDYNDYDTTVGLPVGCDTIWSCPCTSGGGSLGYCLATVASHLGPGSPPPEYGVIEVIC